MSDGVDPDLEGDLDPDLEPSAATLPNPVVLLSVIGVGGALGTLARYQLGQALPASGNYGFPYATFWANVSGAFALGLLVAVLARQWPRAHYLRPALGTGVLGGYTTFSTYTVETVLRLHHGHVPLGLAYALLSLVCGVGAAFAGIALGGGRETRP